MNSSNKLYTPGLDPMYIFMWTEGKHMPVQIFTEQAFDTNFSLYPEILQRRIFFYATLEQGLT